MSSLMHVERIAEANAYLRMYEHGTLRGEASECTHVCIMSIAIKKKREINKDHGPPLKL